MVSGWDFLKIPNAQNLKFPWSRLKNFIKISKREDTRNTYYSRFLKLDRQWSKILVKFCFFFILRRQVTLLKSAFRKFMSRGEAEKRKTNKNFEFLFEMKCLKLRVFCSCFHSVLSVFIGPVRLSHTNILFG